MALPFVDGDPVSQGLDNTIAKWMPEINSLNNQLVIEYTKQEKCRQLTTAAGDADPSN
ncbi:MAG TPA: hypothetical protein PLW86_12665 [Rhodocyclaceae bacterium]|nr:hypothetical protein [Rhodocyclaceae bacterium]